MMVLEILEDIDWLILSRTYVNNTQGTINYTTGQIKLTSLNITSI
jgi:hypothetical protein